MRERPIPFSASMITAILEDRKTQTRRVIKPQPSGAEIFPPSLLIDLDKWYFRDAYCAAEDHEVGQYVRCPYGVPGDRLWVKETWYCDDYLVQRAPFLRPDDWIDGQQEDFMFYRATDCAPDGSTYTGFSGETMRNPWRSSRFMPKWAARIWLELTAVRVERLQDIREEDVQAEGVMIEPDPVSRFESYRLAFNVLWDSINAKRGYSWDSNPWVWVLTFRRMEDP